MDEAVVKRIMPHSSEAEQSVIGSMLIDNDTISDIAEKLNADDFYQYQYGILFDAIISLHNAGMKADIITVQNKLKEKNVAPELYSLEFLGNIVTSVPYTSNVGSYAEIVLEKSILRKTIKFSDDLANRCYQEKEPLSDLMTDAEKSVFQISQMSHTSGDFIPISDAVGRTFAAIQEASRSKGNVTGIRTGFTDLDYKTSGLQKSDLILIAGRPAMGKTAFALSLVEHVAVKSKIPTAVFSLEMADTQLVKRLLAINGSVDLHNINTGDLAQSEWESLVQSVADIADSKLFIVDNVAGLTINDICSKCRKLKTEQNLGLVVIDYLQLIESSRRSDSRQQEIANISRTLKSLARELDIPIIALSQLNRGLESREDKRPKLSDLRESGAIEQDADIVMFLYREEVYDPKPENEGLAELIIGKHRNGSIGKIDLAWIGKHTRYANLARNQSRGPEQ